MKKIILFFGLLVTCWQVTAQYCTPAELGTGCTSGDEISDFTIPTAGFSHLGSGCSANNYGDFTDDATLEINLAQATIYDFEITHDFGGQWVKIWIDFDGDQNFDASEVIFTSTEGANPTNGTLIIPTTVPQGTTRMRVVDIWGQEPNDPCSPDGTWGETHDYTINILPPPSCPFPFNFALESSQTNSFLVSWDDVPEATNGYEWFVFNPGDDPDTEMPLFTGPVAAGQTSVSIGGLTENTTYDIYLQANCDGGDESIFVSLLNISTACNAFLAPITENFDGSDWVSGTGFLNEDDAIDNCWNRSPTSSPDYFWGVGTADTDSFGTGPIEANSGVNYIYTESNNGQTGDEAFLISPLIDLSPLSEPALTFWYHMFGTEMGDLSVDVDAGSGFDMDVFSISGQQQTAEEDAFIEQIVDLSAYSGQTVRIRFRGTKGTGFSDSDMAIDDFKVDEAPTCIKPFNLTSVEVFSDSIEISWSLISNATAGYIWEVYAPGADPDVDAPLPPNGTFPAGTTTGIADGLTELTDYDLYLTSDCDANGTSELAGPLSFSTVAICPSPANITVDNITEDAADIIWEESFNASNGYDWELFLDGEDPATATPLQNSNEAFGTTTLNLTSLTDNTDYDFYITSNCNTDGNSLTEGPISFTTLALPPANDDICDAIPLTVGVIPPGDTYTNLGATGQTDEPAAMCFNGGIDGSVWFTFVAPDSGEVEVSTDIEGATLTDTEVAIYDEPSDCADPTTLGAELGCDQDGGDLIIFNSIVNLTGLTAGDTYYIQVDQWGTTTPGDFGISVIDTNPPCPAPENVVNDGITNTTADFSWDEVTEATVGYNWFVYEEGADITDTTISPIDNGSVDAVTFNVSVNGLVSNTTYDFYIQSDCDSAGTSSLGSPLTFTTLCDTFTAPYFQDFESFTATTTLEVQDCFTEISSDNFAWDVSDSGTPSGNTGPDQANSGTNFIFTEASSGVQGDEAIILLPTIDLSDLSEPSLSFWYHMYGADMGTFHIDIDDGTNLDMSVFSLSGEQQADNNEAWIEQFVDLSAYAGETIQVRFRVERGGGINGDVAIDDVNFDEAPSCFNVTGFTATPVVTTALLSWDESASATDGYLLEVFEDGETVAFSSQTLGQTTTSFEITGLTEGASYVAEITSDCGTDGPSQTVQITFTTVSFGDNCNAPIEVGSLPFTTTDDTANYSDFYNGAPGTECGTTSSYLNGNDVVYSYTPANDMVVLVSMNPTDTWSGIFVYESCDDIGTQCFNGAANASTDIREFEVNLQAGQEYIFVISTFPLPQTTGYTFELTEVLCGAVSGVETTFVSDTEIDFAWDAVPNATNYQWSLFFSGDDPATATPVDSNSTSDTFLNLNNLDSATAYDFYVVSDCSGDLGNTTGPFTVVTECAPEGVPTAIEDFEDADFNYNNNDLMPCWSEGTGTLTNSMSVTVENGTWGSKDFNNTATDPNGIAANVNLFGTGTSWLISQQIDLGDGSLDLVVEYDVLVTSWANDNSTPVTDMGQHTVSLVVSPDGGTTWSDADVIKVFDNSNIPSNPQTDFIPLDGYTGIVKIGFYANRVTSEDLDFFIDNFRVREAPTCFDPLNLEVLSVTDTSADLSWDAGSGETNFDVEVVESGTTPTGTPTFEDVTAPFTATGLTTETDYDFYVRADCGAGDESFWVGPVSFRTAITPVTVVVNNPAINITYCYDNNEFKEWLFVSSDGTTAVEVDFNAGTIEDGTGSTDRFRVFDGFDSNAPLLYDTNVDGIDMTGVTLTANSGAAYILLESDLFGSCQNGIDTEDELDFDVFAGVLSTVAFSADNFNYYPNPVESILNIDSANPIESVQVFDILGKEVFNQDFDNQDISIDFSGLSSGTYLMKVDINSSSQTFRVIKE